MHWGSWIYPNTTSYQMDAYFIRWCSTCAVACGLFVLTLDSTQCTANDENEGELSQGKLPLSLLCPSGWSSNRLVALRILTPGLLLHGRARNGGLAQQCRWDATPTRASPGPTNIGRLAPTIAPHSCRPQIPAADASALPEVLQKGRVETSHVGIHAHSNHPQSVSPSACRDTYARSPVGGESGTQLETSYGGKLTHSIPPHWALPAITRPVRAPRPEGPLQPVQISPSSIPASLDHSRPMTPPTARPCTPRATLAPSLPTSL